MTNYFINKQLNELNRLENILSRYPDVGPNPNPDRMALEHVMLFEEHKKLKNKITREANTFGYKNLFEENNQTANPFKLNQSLRVDNPYLKRKTIYSKYLSGENRQTDEESDQVSSEERRKACDELIPNGCGGRTIMKGSWIPDNPSGFNFTPACNSHDRNYSTLGFDFDEANRRFLIEMTSAVQARAHAGTDRHKEGMEIAQIYYNYVVENGKSYYDDAQRNAYICKYGKRPK